MADEPDMDATAESDADEVQRRTRWWGRHAQKYSFLDVSDKAKDKAMAAFAAKAKRQMLQSAADRAAMRRKRSC